MMKILEELKKDEMKYYTPSLIPIYRNGNIVASIPFDPNLSMRNVPSYINQSCEMGLGRIPEGKYEGQLVIMYEDEFFPSRTRGEFIDETEAYELCIERGKLNVIKKYNITPCYGSDVDVD